MEVQKKELFVVVCFRLCLFKSTTNAASVMRNVCQIANISENAGFYSPVVFVVCYHRPQLRICYFICIYLKVVVMSERSRVDMCW